MIKIRKLINIDIVLLFNVQYSHFISYPDDVLYSSFFCLIQDHAGSWCTFSPLLIWNISLALLCVPWPWHFWNTQSSYFVECPSVWVVWGFLVIRFRNISSLVTPQKCCPSQCTWCQLVPLLVISDHSIHRFLHCKVLSLIMNK